jgi:hypothetical protein
VQPNGSNMSTQSADNSPRSTVNSTIQAPRRKFVDEGKLRKVGKLLAINLLLSASFASLNKLFPFVAFPVYRHQFEICILNSPIDLYNPSHSGTSLVDGMRLI